MRFGTILAVILGVLAAAVQAGGRVGPVAPLCSPEAQTKEIDAAGVEDQCVSRTPPRCKSGKKPSVDAAGDADRCMPEASGGKTSAAAAAAGDEPVCRAGLTLRVRPREDVCERVEKPSCPSGLKLRPRRGEDACVP